MLSPPVPRTWQAQFSVNRRPHSWTVLWAIHTAAAIVACADGCIDRAERDRLSAYLNRCQAKILKSPLTRGLFDKCLRELERDPVNEWCVLARVLAGFDGTSWVWIILRAAEHVAAADGAVDHAEVQAIDAIRSFLNLPPRVPEPPAVCSLGSAGA